MLLLFVNPKVIQTIFTNFLFAIGVILLVVGFVRGILITTRLIVFDTYPLENWEETRCENMTPAMIQEPNIKQPNLEESEKFQTRCKEEVAHSRKVRQVEDIATVAGLLVSGVALSYFFRNKTSKA